MNLPDGRLLIASDGVIPDPSAAGGRIILWLRGAPSGGYRHWERVSSVVQAATTVERGFRAIEAASIPARQWAGGTIGKLFRRRGLTPAERLWTLPDGTSAEQCGPRRTDRVLAWTDDEAIPIDETRVRSRWGGLSEARVIGVGLYLISGVEPTQPVATMGPGPPSPSPVAPLQLAEREMDLARGTGDGRRQMTALADLGLAHLKGGDTRRAEDLLGEALARARLLGDRSMELGVMIDLGLAALVSGRPDRAREILGPLTALARAIGDRPAEKLALDRMGEAHSNLGDHDGARDCFERALAIAARLGDGKHEADLLWRIAIQHAEMGRHNSAIAHGQAAVDLMRRLGRPQADWFAHHLAGFRSGGSEHASSETVSRGEMALNYLNTSIDTSSLTSHLDPRSPSDPGPLRMALSAAGSMAKFLGSGFRTVASEAYRDRVEACASCEHHTGLRCRVCGCFTAAKARLQHERCPVGKWRT